MKTCHNCPDKPQPGSKYERTKCATCPLMHPQTDPPRGMISLDHPDARALIRNAADPYSHSTVGQPADQHTTSPAADVIVDYLLKAKRDRARIRRMVEHGRGPVPGGRVVQAFVEHFSDRDEALLAIMRDHDWDWCAGTWAKQETEAGRKISKQAVSKRAHELVKRVQGLAYLLAPRSGGG